MRREDESMFGGIGAMLDDLEAFYKDVHRHPELSMQEERTAALAADRLQALTSILQPGPSSGETSQRPGRRRSSLDTTR